MLDFFSPINFNTHLLVALYNQGLCSASCAGNEVKKELQALSLILLVLQIFLVFSVADYKIILGTFRTDTLN